MLRSAHAEYESAEASQRASAAMASPQFVVAPKFTGGMATPHATGSSTTSSKRPRTSPTVNKPFKKVVTDKMVRAFGAARDPHKENRIPLPASGYQPSKQGTGYLQNKSATPLFEEELARQSSKNNKQEVETECIDLTEWSDVDFEDDLEVVAPKAALPSNGPTKMIQPTAVRQQQYSTPRVDLTDGPGLASSSLHVPWSSSPMQHMLPRQMQKVEETCLHDAAPKPDPPRTRPLPWAQTAEPDIKNIQQYTHTTGRATSKIADFLNPSALPAKRKTVKQEGTVDSAASMIASKKKRAQRVPKIFLTEEQQHVVNLVVEEKESVFFTGSAGTGKSVLMREIITSLRRKFSKEPDRIAVCASTGLAACNVGGVTLHSFAGIGLGKEEVPELVKKIKRNQKARHRWLRTKVLIIDEISMVDGELFDKLEAVARQLRNNGRPFGGMQLVITGDFFQLPPVPDGGRAAKFSFDASTWNTVIRHTIGLHQVFRQKDPAFAAMLNEMREGRLSDSSVKAFHGLRRAVEYPDKLEATALFPLRSEVDRENTRRLEALHGQAYIFEARDGGAITDKVARDKLLSNCMAPAEITLKKGAQVMLIKNVDETLVNGSIGNVIAFMDSSQFDKFSTDVEAYEQYEDGTFMTQAEKDLSKEEKARKRLMDNITTARKFPLVRFNIPDGTTRDMLCEPESWKIELPSGEIQASRSQIPLILSWALSIHKAQGQTLERVKVDLGKIFEKGQAYVALSRATSMAGLQVLNFDQKKVMAHDKVVNFYKNLAKFNSDSVNVKKDQKTTTRGSDYEKKYLEGAYDFQ